MTDNTTQHQSLFNRENALLGVFIVFAVLGSVFHWDWIQWLITPGAILVGTFWINQRQREFDLFTADERLSKEQIAADKRYQSELNIAYNNQREATFQVYIDRLSELLIVHNLREAPKDSDIYRMAYMRTLLVFSRLDPVRKGLALLLLQDSKLINKDKCIISLSGADLRKANLKNGHLIETNLNEIYLDDADLSSANLRDADLRSAHLTNVSLDNASLIKADLKHADMQNLKSSKGTQFWEADLSHAKLMQANLSGANLGAAILKHAELSGAHLIDAELREANLSEADLSNAKLMEADLRGADLTEADLRGADLTGALVNVPLLEEQTTLLQNTIMPNGDIHP